ncbi:MAG TPA: ATP-binding cassette domain-containing protein [Candidatus Hydrogenedentes bacterium]|nr:ATP-binding cassette domain-containing protein [Candidatus Hydrogenedentota bacterium]
MVALDTPSPPVLEAQDIEVTYSVALSGWFGGNVLLRAVRGVSLWMRAGECVGLVGESGCGKSSLGRVLAGLERPAAGTVLIDGRPVQWGRQRAARRHRGPVQMVFQNPYASLNPRMSALDAVAEAFRYREGIDWRSARNRARQLLEEVGIEEALARRYPAALSGGQRQRVAVARALACRPRLLIADEAVSALDVSVQAQTLNTLRESQKRLGFGMLFISHDISVVRHLADRIMVMYLGRIVEEGPAEAVLDAPRHPYTEALTAAARWEAASVKGEPPSPLSPPPGCPYHTRCPLARNTCAAAEPPLQTVDGDHRTACPHWRELNRTLARQPEPDVSATTGML